MVVCYRRIAHSLCADGPGGCARPARRSLSRQWGQRVPLVWHHDFRWWLVGRLLGIGDESASINTESEDRRVDALFEMQRFHDGRTSLYVGESATVCPLFELRVLDRSCRPAPLLPQSN